MKRLAFCICTSLLLVSLSHGNDWQVWKQTDWSRGWWLGSLIPEDDTSAFGWDERIDFWSTPGQFSLSPWVGITLGEGVEWGLPWGYWSDGIQVFLELPNGTLLAGGPGNPPIARSIDGGDTWTRITGMPGGTTYNIIRAYDGTIFADLLVGSIPWRGYVYRSTDDGATWVLDWDLKENLEDWCIVGALIQFKDSTLIATVRNCYLVAERKRETGEWEVRTVFEDTTYFTNPYLYLEDKDVLYTRGAKKVEDGWRDISFKSTDRGYTWEEVRDGFTPWFALFRGQDGAFYGSTYGPYILRSEDRGESWDSIANLKDPLARGSTNIRCLLQAKDGTYYAGVEESYGCGPSPNRVKRSTDGGYTWQDDLFFYDNWAARWPRGLFEDSEGNIFLGTDLGGMSYGIGCQIWKKAKITKYNCFGHLAGAAVFDEPMEWGRVDWDCDENGGEIKVKVRTRGPSGSHEEEILGWFEYVEKGQDVSKLPYVFDGDKMIHYLVELYPSKTCTESPVFHEIRIEYQNCTGTEEEKRSLPSLPGLMAIPNPFDQHSTIRYGLPELTRVELKIYDLNGRLIRTLADEEQEVGYHEILWDGRNDAGVSVGTGVYFLKFETDTFKETKKLLILK